LVHLEAEKEEKVDSSMNETQVLRVHSTKEIAIQNYATQYTIDRHNLQTVESAGGEVAQRKGRISYGREKLLTSEKSMEKSKRDLLSRFKDDVDHLNHISLCI
jgi:predicted DNA-binding protein (UPF0251 family)